MNQIYVGFGALAVLFVVGFFWLNRKGAREKQLETMKAIVWFCLVNGCGWVWSSYILAYYGREQIAESLSKVALTEIVVVVCTYALKALVEQLSKHNKWPDKSAAKKKEEDDHVGLSD